MPMKNNCMYFSSNIKIVYRGKVLGPGAILAGIRHSNSIYLAFKYSSTETFKNPYTSTQHYQKWSLPKQRTTESHRNNIIHCDLQLFVHDIRPSLRGSREWKMAHLQPTKRPPPWQNWRCNHSTPCPAELGCTVWSCWLRRRSITERNGEKMSHTVALCNRAAALRPRIL